MESEPIEKRTMYHEREERSRVKADKPESRVFYFKTSADFRKWLEANHDSAQEIWVGLYQRDSANRGITYSEALDEALCYGWIDGALLSIDANRWMKRFTPRKKGSIWSLVNVKRAEELIGLGSMNDTGLKAFNARRDDKTGVYSYEQEDAELSEPYAKKFRKNRKAWDFFNRQAASYRKTTTYWVVRAKREDTRMKRLDELIAESAKGKRLARFTYSLWKEKKSGKK
jgi:uncharacterized protein YdeI (YjbR/CyaY-like superfamily)